MLLKMKKKIPRIGFVINYRLKGWLGVTNYYKNLFKTIYKNNKKQIEIVIITDFLMTNEEKKQFKTLKIIQSDLFNRKSKIIKIFNLLSILLTGKNFLVDNFLLNNLLL